MISFDFQSLVNSNFRIKSTILKISSFCKMHLIEEFKLHLSMLITQFNLWAMLIVHEYPITQPALGFRMVYGD